MCIALQMHELQFKQVFQKKTCLIQYSLIKLAFEMT